MCWVCGKILAGWGGGGEVPQAPEQWLPCGGSFGMGCVGAGVSPSPRRAAGKSRYPRLGPWRSPCRISRFSWRPAARGKDPRRNRGKVWGGKSSREELLWTDRNLPSTPGCLGRERRQRSWERKSEGEISGGWENKEGGWEGVLFYFIFFFVSQHNPNFYCKLKYLSPGQVYFACDSN